MKALDRYRQLRLFSDTILAYERYHSVKPEAFLIDGLQGSYGTQFLAAFREWPHLEGLCSSPGHFFSIYRWLWQLF